MRRRYGHGSREQPVAAAGTALPSHRSGAPRELAVEIMRSPILAACLEEKWYRLACYDVAVGSGGLPPGRWENAFPASCRSRAKRRGRHATDGPVRDHSLSSAPAGHG